MDSHDSTNISGEISSTCCDCKVFGRIEAVRIDHEVTVVLVNGWCLASIAAIEEFREGPLLGLVDRMHVKPCTVTGQDNGVPLRH